MVLARYRYGFDTTLTENMAALTRLLFSSTVLLFFKATLNVFRFRTPSIASLSKLWMRSFSSSGIDAPLVQNPCV